MKLKRFENFKLNENEEIDLFEDYENLPQEVNDIIAKYPDGLTYPECEEFIKELEKVGYTCDYGLDAVPYGLKKIENTELRSVEVEYEDGTIIPTSMAAHLTDDEINDYFAVGKEFNIGNGELDNMQKVKKVEILK
jgi:hypothetical protein